jgi:hypothetical protein
MKNNKLILGMKVAFHDCSAPPSGIHRSGVSGHDG